jgi:hypothetical protein
MKGATKLAQVNLQRKYNQGTKAGNPIINTC